MSCSDGKGCAKAVERPLTVWDVLDDAIGAWRDERDAKRQFAFAMAEKQGQNAKEIVGALYALVPTLFGGPAAVLDEEHAPVPGRRFSMVEDALAQVSKESRRNVLAALRLYDEQTAVGVLELFFADLEAKKSPRFPPMEPQTPAPGRF